ncbi:hypothetical protein AB3S75_022527 [Citrus x aurantiifolia]
MLKLTTAARIYLANTKARKLKPEYFSFVSQQTHLQFTTQKHLLSYKTAHHQPTLPPTTAPLTVENSSCEESTIDLEAKLACHLSFCNLQPAAMEDESDLLSWQNSYGEEYQHISMEQLNLLEV